ncbi:MAG TPA: ATP-binding protein [Acidimicrobiales bacterium]|nr:ATP-binding protein [Acidimicrobiales bacterium]HJM29014.1 ATP-binding protein [Acidimicrobiales bacterium]HJM98489.1 ATP-binding protein [Acidimicrobiales bacterium]
MSLRAQLTLAFTILMTLIVAVSGFVAVNSAENHLVSGVDDFLEKRVDNIGAGQEARSKAEKNLIRLRNLEEILSEPDSVTQLVNAKGEVIIAYPFKLPINNSDISLATGSKDVSMRSRVTKIRTAQINGDDYRIISSQIPGGGIAQVARDLTEVRSAVSGMVRSFLLLGLGAIAVGILLGWVLASRLTKPITRLSKAAKHVAKTQDLQAYIDLDDGDLEVRALANSFNIMLQALSESREQQRRLVADASHELRTPLTSLRTNIEVLSRTNTITEDEREVIINDLQSEIEELSLLVGEIVELATAESREEEEFDEIDLSEIALEVIQKFQRRSGRNIQLVAIGTSTRYVQRSSINRAISNLIDNAIKFSPKDSEVIVSVTDGRIEVRDFGLGVEDEDESRLFDRFFRSVGTRDLPGSGLGLSIVHEIAKAHGGQVFVAEPEDGIGTIVGFTI